MIAFIPVYRYKVTFQVAKGSLYSEFDRLLLEAVNRGTSDLDELTSLFGIHRSVVVSALATLMQAGWLGLRPENGGTRYAVSRSGKAALHDSDTLPASMSLTTRTATLIMERVEGQLIRGGDVTFFHRLDLEKAMRFGVVIQKSDIRHTPEPALVKPFLRVNAECDEYIRSIGPISVLRGGGDFVPAIVEPASRRVIGLPPAWERRLTDELYSAVIRREAEIVQQYREETGEGNMPPGYDEERRQIEEQIAQEAEIGWLGDVTADENDTAPVIELDLGGRGPKGVSSSDNLDGGVGQKETSEASGEWPMRREDISLIRSREEHVAELASRLRTADSWSVLAVTQVTKSGIDAVMAEVTRALSRGVDIDILWAEVAVAETVDSIRGFELLRDMERSSQAGALKGRLMVASGATTIGTNILITNHGNYCEATAGSYSWLGPPREGRELSVKTRSAGIISTICMIVADVLRADRNLERSRNSQALLNASATLERQASATRRNSDESAREISGRVVFDREHYTWLEEQMADLATPLEFVDLGCAGTVSGFAGGLPEFVRRACSVASRTTIRCANTQASTSADSGFPNDGTLSIVNDAQSLEGYLVCGRNKAIITTFDWMAAKERACERALKHLGLSLSGPECGMEVLRAIHKQSSP